MRRRAPLLVPEVAEALADFIAPRPAPEVDDADLLALALGVAGGAAQEACARALLASPSVRGRLIRQAESCRELEEALGGLDGEARRHRALDHYRELATRAGRALAEGLQAGEDLLRRSLAGMRVGWRLAAEREDHEAVSAFVDALAAELMERGAWEELAELAAYGYHASDALARPSLRSRLLSYEGAAAAYRGDEARAVLLWTQRVEINRRIGKPVPEADALLDLLGQATQAGDALAWEGWIVQAEDAVARADRADLTARLLTLRAHERLKAGDRKDAALHAERSLAVLSGSLGLETGFYVRIVAARALSECGCSQRALRALADLLALALEERRPVPAAAVMEALSDVTRSAGLEEAASRCELAALSIHQSLGMRRAHVLADTLFLRHGARKDPPKGPWEIVAREVLAEIEELRPESAFVEGVGTPI